MLAGFNLPGDADSSVFCKESASSSTVSLLLLVFLFDHAITQLAMSSLDAGGAPKINNQ